MIQMLISGNVGGDATVNVIEGGTKIINFSVAHTEKWMDRQQVQQTRTVWVKCSWFRSAEQSTEVAKYIRKGGTVTVIGKPAARAWQSDTDGSIHAALELRVSELQLGSTGNNDGAQSSGEPQQADTPAPTASPEGGGDDLPF